ncbi:MAG: ATP-dependent DNA helicase RecG [Actinobacteria bacterium]|nr:ATP-dependent DNA helicase RecG [Actinomycetota bacterium]
MTASESRALPRSLGGEPVNREALLGAPVRAPRPSLLRAPLKLPSRQAESAQTLGIETVGDLLEHVPAGHEFRAAKAVAALKGGDEATVEVVVQSIQLRPTRRRNFRIVEARVADATGSAKAVWFNQAYLAKQLTPGTRLRLFGKVKSGALQVREHSVLAPAIAGETAVSLPAAPPPQGAVGLAVVGVYTGTEGLKSQRLRELIAAQRGMELNCVEPLPGRMRAAERLLDRPSALAEMHFPRDPATAAAARERLAFEELLQQQLALGMRRHRRVSGRSATPLAARDGIVARWLERLPFELTADQRAAIAEIDADLAAELPMQRLLMGEVGSGKTVVALAAMLRAAENECQAALMAPTETLAEQHFATLDAMLPETPIALLTGSTPAARRREILARLATGELPLIVGTHALIEPTVEFRSLALAVVDEQHRFGVRQRAALDAKAPGDRVPHVLHMTATPIPRTLALTGYGDLDFTRITELPLGRKPIETRIVGDAQRAAAYEEVREQLRAGRQAYVVCPLVSESEELQARAATTEAERLATGEFKDFRVGLLHGQLSAAEKSAAMAAFKDGSTDVLVATSVVEVGVDVPNAVAMVIEDAERYGISQLHQLRGRIGRGGHTSVCLLFGAPASRRLRAVASERDGFKLAQVDLELRGSGEELGTRQSGLPRFRVAVLPDDNPLLERAATAARQLLQIHPSLEDPTLDLLRATVIARYGDEIDPIPA